MISKTLCLTSLCLALPISVSADTILANAADARVRIDGNISSTANTVEVGSHGTSGALGDGKNFRSNFVMPFLLPTLGAGETFANANLTFRVSAKDGIGLDENVDLYGLSRINAAPNALAIDFFEGFGDPNNTKLQDNLLTSNATSTGVNSTDTAGDAALTAFLIQQYAGGSNAGQYIYLRMVMEVEPNNNVSRFKIATRDAASASVIPPTITFDVIPEPSSLAVLLGLSGLLIARRRWG